MAKMDKRVITLKDGIVEIESPKIEDAEELIRFIKTVDIETDFLIREPDEFKFGLEDEQKFIQSKLESERDLFLKATYHGQIVGTLGFDVLTNKRYRHRGQFGIAIQKACWGKGIGKALMETLLEWCKQIGIEKITLEVDANNERAIELYKKYGFEQEGYLKNDKKMSDGSYRDSLIMAKMMIE